MGSSHNICDNSNGNELILIIVIIIKITAMWLIKNAERSTDNNTDSDTDNITDPCDSN